MIEIVTAIYQEADGLINGLNLHRQAQAFPFSVYASETDSCKEERQGQAGDSCIADRTGGIRLTITGTGRVAAAAAVGTILGRYTREELQNVQLVNFGSCARISDEFAKDRGPSSDGDERKLCLIHKITDKDTGRTYYPDLLLKSSLPEAEIITGDRALQDSEIREAENSRKSEGDGENGLQGAVGRRVLLYDMEAAGIYAAGRFFLGPHQMHFLKGITDTGVNSRMDSGEFSSRMNTYAADAVKYIRQVAASGQENRQPLQEDQTVQRISAEVHASATMQLQIRQLVHYAVLTQRDPDRIFADCCENFFWKNPVRRSADLCHDRREGKILLEMFRNCIAS